MSAFHCTPGKAAERKAKQGAINYASYTAYALREMRWEQRSQQPPASSGWKAAAAPAAFDEWKSTPPPHTQTHTRRTLTPAETDAEVGVAVAEQFAR